MMKYTDRESLYPESIDLTERPHSSPSYPLCHLYPHSLKFHTLLLYMIDPCLVSYQLLHSLFLFPFFLSSSPCCSVLSCLVVLCHVLSRLVSHSYHMALLLFFISLLLFFISFLLYSISLVCRKEAERTGSLGHDDCAISLARRSHVPQMLQQVCNITMKDRTMKKSFCGRKGVDE